MSFFTSSEKEERGRRTGAQGAEQCSLMSFTSGLYAAGMNTGGHHSLEPRVLSSHHGHSTQAGGARQSRKPQAG